MLKEHAKVTSQFNNELENEVRLVRAKMEEKLAKLSLPVKVHLFLIPLNTKQILIECLDGKLKGLQ